jgi:hypothetical protein
MDLTDGSETSANINQTPGKLKMDLTDGSETANINQTPGKHPNVDTNTEHSVSLKSRITLTVQISGALPPPPFYIVVATGITQATDPSLE